MLFEERQPERVEEVPLSENTKGQKKQFFYHLKISEDKSDFGKYIWKDFCTTEIKLFGFYK